MGLFREIFSWWGGNTWGTRLTTALRGRLVGEDATGNRYYEATRGYLPNGKSRRWVIFNGEAEPTKVGADWHGWLHYTVDTPPTKDSYVPKPWQIGHRANPTGSASAYRPPGSVLAAGKPASVQGQYQPWKPE